MSSSRSVAQEMSPRRTDEPELAGQRGRRLAGGETHEVDQREAVRFDRRTVTERQLEPRDRIAVARLAAKHLVIDQFAQRPDRRVLVGDPGQQQFLDARGPRPGCRTLVREIVGESVEQAIDIGAQPRLEVREGSLHGARPVIGFVAGDQEVADLVEQPERGDVAGLDRRRSGRTSRVHPIGQATQAVGVGHDEVAARPDQRTLDGIARPRLAPDVELMGIPNSGGVAHRGSIARPPRVHSNGSVLRPRRPRRGGRRRRDRSRVGAARARTDRSHTPMAGSGPVATSSGRDRRPVPRAT